MLTRFAIGFVVFMFVVIFAVLGITAHEINVALHALIR